MSLHSMVRYLSFITLLQSGMLILMSLIMTEGVLCTGLHARVLLIKRVYTFTLGCFQRKLTSMPGQAGRKEDLMLTDNTGFTPFQLAADKNYSQVTFFFLGNARKLIDKQCDGNSLLGELSKLGLLLFFGV